MTIPIQMNYDHDIGPRNDGWKLQTNIQPVIPFTLNDDWNLITRTIVPVIAQDDIFPGAGSQSGLGDINMSLFLSPGASDPSCSCERRRTTCSAARSGARGQPAWP
jgi:hypothetical protein